jgi:hypothetical protein
MRESTLAPFSHPFDQAAHFLFLGRCVTRRQALEQSLNNRLGQRSNDDRLSPRADISA